MRPLIVFEQVTADGWFAAPDGDIGWAHRAPQDEEWRAFAAGNARAPGPLLFGRKTYEMMVAYWPTPQAARENPAVAEGMNARPKVVFSRTLENPAWANTRIVKDDLVGEVRRMKAEAGEPLVVLGSGSVVAQLARERLVDEFQLAVVPVVLGAGKSLFDGVKLDLRRKSARAFQNGNTLLVYTT